MKSHGGAQSYVFAHNTSSTQMKMPLTDKYPPELCSVLIANNLSIGPAVGRNLRLVEYTEVQALPRTVIGHNGYNKAAAGLPCQQGERPFASLAELQEQAGLERGSVLLPGYEIFENAPEPPHTGKGTPLVSPASVDLRLKPDSMAVDAGMTIPGINDGFAGQAPDLGAYETAQPMPTYGPRGGPYLEWLAELRAGKYVPWKEPDGGAEQGEE